MPINSNILQVIINGKNNAGPSIQSATRMIAQFQTVVAAAMTAAAVRAGQFEKSLAEISTLLDGDTGPAIARMRKELLDLSVTFGQTTGRMARARYDIISAGFTDAADSVQVLNAANKLAVAGVTDVAKTADLLTTALNGLGLTADDSAQTADVLFQIVRSGKTTMDELAVSMGPVFASARVAKIGLEELGGVLATTTAAGIDTRESATALSQLLLALAAPSGEAKDALDDLEISLDQGLAPALVRLSHVSEDGLNALSKLIPNIRALKAAGAAAADIDKLNANLDAMAGSAGATDEAVGKMAATFDFQLKQARSALDALVIEVGTLLLPTFTSIVGKIRDAAVMLRFMVFESDLAKTAIRNLAAVAKVEFALALETMGRMVSGLFDPLLNLAQSAVRKLVESLSGYFSVLSRATQRGEIGQWIRETQAGLIEFGGSLEELKRKGFVDLQSVITDAGGFFANLAEDATDAGLALSGPLLDALRLVQVELKAAERAAVSATRIVQTGFGAKTPGEALGPAVPKKEKKKEKEDPKSELDQLKEQIESLAEFTEEDFANMAFSIGDSFAMIAADVGATMLGLRKGPIMLGRAFAQMAAGILSDIARIIARLLVAKAIMAAFGGGGIFGGIAKGLGLTSNSHGGMIPRAAFGLEFPAMVAAGSPGLDRSLALVHGGELMVPRQTVEAVNRGQQRARIAPPPARRSRARGGVVQQNFQVVRPFRREEQVLLADSTREAEQNAKRYRG